MILRDFEWFCLNPQPFESRRVWWNRILSYTFAIQIALFIVEIGWYEVAGGWGLVVIFPCTSRYSGCMIGQSEERRRWAVILSLLMQLPSWKTDVFREALSWAATVYSMIYLRPTLKVNEPIRLIWIFIWVNNIIDRLTGFFHNI